MGDGLEELKIQLLAQLEDQSRKAVQAMRAVVDRAVKAETRTFLQWLSAHYINHPQAPELVEITGAWEKLNADYAKRRARRKPNARGFFQYSGDMGFDFFDVSDATKLFGNPTVGNVKAGKIAEGDFNRLISVTPFRDIRLLLDQKRWKGVDIYAAGDNKAIRRKLMNIGEGGERHYRPLVGPAMIIFTQTKIKAAIIEALRRNGYEVK